jgi:hypothetical protein
MPLSGKEPKGLGGWLILVGFIVIITPLRLTLMLFNQYIPIFMEGNWEVLTTPGSEAYHELWAPVLLYEIVGNALLVIFGIVLIILFFQKSYRFPAFMIGFIVFNLLFVIGDIILANMIPYVASGVGMESYKDLLQTLVSASIWIPYFLISKRVNNTFIKSDTGMDKPMTVEGGI